MCVTYFEWQIHKDTFPLLTTFLEDHRCVYDTPDNIKSKFSINDCNASYNTSGSGSSGAILTNDKFCTCDPNSKGNNCNEVFDPKFGEPEKARTLCGTSKLLIDNANPVDESENTASVIVPAMQGIIINLALIISWYTN